MGSASLRDDARVTPKESTRVVSKVLPGEDRHPGVTCGWKKENE